MVKWGEGLRYWRQRAKSIYSRDVFEGHAAYGRDGNLLRITGDLELLLLVRGRLWIAVVVVEMNDMLRE